MAFTLRICGVEGPTQNASMFGLFVKIPSYPVAATTLLDLNMGANGYIRWILTSAGDVRLQCSLLGHSTDVSMISGTALPIGSWNWCSGSCGRWTTAPSGDNKAVWSGVFASGGTQLGSTAFFDTQSHYGLLDYTAQVGIGVSLSSSNNNFPNSAGWAWSKARVSYTNPSPPWATIALLGIPGSDWGGGDGLAYNCRQAVGAQSTLPDSIDAFTGTAGPLGCTINADGPFA